MKPLGQLEPDLVVMFIGWTSRKFMLFFVDQKYKKEKRDPKVSKRVLAIFNLL